ncbi:MAG: hypothetical protein K2I77_01450 [Anaeroplasmataceae bacterium]|nr:hypothetical protein [Anaeroplasmataceae bacterium]
MEAIRNVQLTTVYERILALFEQTKTIHVTVKNKRNLIIDAPSRIVGVYERFLCVESLVNHYIEKFTINYTDLITSKIIIKELDN